MVGTVYASSVHVNYPGVPVVDGVAVLRPGDRFIVSFLGSQYVAFYGKDDQQFTWVKVPDVLAVGVL